jgi:hypothetical protein
MDIHKIRSWLVNAYVLSLIEMENIRIKGDNEAECEKYKIISSEFGILTTVLEYKVAWELLAYWKSNGEVYILESDVSDLDPGILREHIAEEFGKILAIKSSDHQSRLFGKQAVRALSLLTGITPEIITDDIVNDYLTLAET